MSIIKRLQNALQYVWDGAARIFSPADDKYPESGVQPFEGEPFDERKEHTY